MSVPTCLNIKRTEFVNKWMLHDVTWHTETNSYFFFALSHVIKKKKSKSKDCDKPVPF